MAKGSNIIVSNAPRGVYWEGVLTGALLPGTLLQIKTSAGLDDDGNPSFEVYNVTNDGQRAAVFVLLPDIYQGKDELTAYTTGTRCRVYQPIAGDQLNLLSDAAISFGAILVADDGTGKLVAPASVAADYATGGLDTEAKLIAAINAIKNRSQTSPFQALETVSAVDNQLVHVLYTGI